MRPVALSCSSHHNNCDAKVVQLPLGGRLESDFAGSKGRKCFCLRDAVGNLTAEVNYNFQQPLCYGKPQFDWSKAASACILPMSRPLRSLPVGALLRVVPRTRVGDGGDDLGQGRIRVVSVAEEEEVRL